MRRYTVSGLALEAEKLSSMAQETYAQALNIALGYDAENQEIESLKQKAKSFEDDLVVILKRLQQVK